MSAPLHGPIDQALVDRATELGAMAPMFTRDTHPQLWRAWDDRACLLCVTAKMGGDVEAARRECDRYSGHLLPIPVLPPLRPTPRVAGAGSLDAISLLAMGMERFIEGATA